jgi:hypothetical protein
MADIRKVLGQAAPAAETEAALYTAPYAAGPVNIKVMNRDNAPTTVRIRIAVADAAVANKQYIAYDFPIPTNGTKVFEDLYLAAADVIYVKAASANVSFQAFGAEATS